MEESNQRRSFAGTRLYAILARKAPIGVVFRRGPSKQVLAIHWDTEKHEFRLGQWFKGRIYEHRCDLSPSGEKLIYFAANYRSPFRTWTAISRPPFLTALALWPKGDAWGGGGLFENERTICLNHRAAEMQLAPDWKWPKSLSVGPLGSYSGRGEDDPIWSTRLLRDGWVLKQPGKIKENKLGSRLWIQFIEDTVWRKSHGEWAIEMRQQGLKEREGPWYVMEHQLTDASGNVVCSMGRSDWADWSQSGEVLFARSGRLYRIALGSKHAPGEPEELIDLRDLKFEPVESPQDAKLWSGRGPRGRLAARKK